MVLPRASPETASRWAACGHQAPCGCWHASCCMRCPFPDDCHWTKGGSTSGARAAAWLGQHPGWHATTEIEWAIASRKGDLARCLHGRFDVEEHEDGGKPRLWRARDGGQPESCH